MTVSTTVEVNHSTTHSIAPGEELHAEYTVHQKDIYVGETFTNFGTGRHTWTTAA